MTWRIGRLPDFEVQGITSNLRLIKQHTLAVSIPGVGQAQTRRVGVKNLSRSEESARQRQMGKSSGWRRRQT